jgi:uncharacterized protein YunC (DUF1805 family)
MTLSKSKNFDEFFSSFGPDDHQHSCGASFLFLHANHSCRSAMEYIEVRLSRKKAEGFVIPLGPANLVAVRTDVGMVGCGAFDVAALDSFSYPAAKVRPSIGPSIMDTDDILTGIVKEANRSAFGRGIRTGMTGREALELL